MFQYQIDYAKSCKSRCKTCKQKIFRNELRIAYVVKSKGFLQSLWNHERCFFKKGKRFAHFTEFENFNTLEHKDQIRIKAQLVDPTEQNNCENDEPKNVLDDRERAILSDYCVEKSKTSNATCRVCSLRIVKDDLRVSKVEYSVRYGETAQFYHLSCFSNIRSEFQFSVGGEYMPGFELLSSEDKENVKNNIRPHAQKPTMKHKIVPERNTVRRNNDEEIRLQNDTFHKHKRALRALSKGELEILCKRNEMKLLKGTEEPLDLLADCMTFGVLQKCPECQGQLQLKSLNYECTGHRDEWSSCNYQTKKPRRKLMEIPPELQKYQAFKDYVPTLGERIFNDERLIEIHPPRPKKPRAANVHAPLKNVQFFIYGLKAERKEALKRRVLRLGGRAVPQLVPTVAAVLSAPDALAKPSTVLEKIEIGGIHVIDEKYLDEIESTPGIELIGALSLIEKHNFADWAFDVLSRVPQDVVEGRPVKVSGNLSSPKSTKPEISTNKVKDGVPVLCVNGLEEVAHVYREDAPFSATLNRTDLNSKFCTNLSCTMQLLEADYSKRYWFVKSTSGSGFKPIITVKEFDDYLSGAKELFKKEFYKKTGNLWSLRHQFEKKHGKYDLVQLANLNETIPVLQMDTQSSLPATLQKLLILLFDINIINKTIADIDVDSRKMPLGVLADEQIKAGYETLLHLFHLVKKGKVSYNRIKDLSNKFYTKIPHKGTEKNLVVLDSVELIKSKVDMLNDLRNTHLSFRLLREEMDKSVNSMETFYNRLNTKIVALDKDSQEFNMILEYFTNTQSKTHLNSFKMHIDEIFLVEREGERERYEPYKSLHNRKLLWHGSRLSNISAILYEGLRIAPPEVIATGHMFGKGIYFADVATKSAQYIHATTDHPTGVLLLCEVALGNMKKCYSNEYVTELPNEYQSVCGVGRIKPDPSHTVTLQDGTIVPLGNIVPNDDMLSTQSQLIHNEYIVYNEAQVTIKYMLQLKFDLCT